MQAGEGAARGATEAEGSSTQRLLDLADAGIWLIDPEGLTSWVNEAASELTGIPAGELAGRPAPQAIAGFGAVLGGEPPAKGRSEGKLSRPDGSQVWVAATGRALVDDDGRPAGTLLTLYDIGEHRRREADLRMRLERSKALLGLAERSLDAPDLAAILGQSVRMVTEQLDAVLTTVSSIDRDRRELRVLAVDGQDDPAWLAELRRGEAIELPDPSLTLSAVERAAPIVVEDFGDRHPYPMLAEHRVRSGAFVPLGGGRTILSTMSRRPGAIGQSSLPLVSSVARMIESYGALLGELERRGCSAPPSAALAGGAATGAPCSHRASNLRGRPRRPS